MYTEEFEEVIDEAIEVEDVTEDSVINLVVSERWMPHSKVPTLE